MVCNNTTSSHRRQRRESILSRKLAALAGATGAIAAGTDAQAVTYSPTAGVAAAQGIPGFSFVDSTNVTLGALRPPATPGNIGWDVDGDTTADFSLIRTITNGETNPFDKARLVPLGAPGANRMFGTFYGSLLKLAVDFNINAGDFEYSQTRSTMLNNGEILAFAFADTGVGQFGFSFTSGANSYFGWGSLVFETEDNTYKITEAYYSTTPGGAINVGAVPVPEPSSMALLAAGAAGVAAWRARRKKQPVGSA